MDGWMDGDEVIPFYIQNFEGQLHCSFSILCFNIITEGKKEIVMIFHIWFHTEFVTQMFCQNQL